MRLIASCLLTFSASVLLRLAAAGWCDCRRTVASTSASGLRAGTRSGRSGCLGHAPIETSAGLPSTNAQGKRIP